MEILVRHQVVRIEPGRKEDQVRLEIDGEDGKLIRVMMSRDQATRMRQGLLVAVQQAGRGL